MNSGAGGARRRVNISDVAREAGVSPTTVSHALNGRGQVDLRTRKRVETAAAKLGYRPNRHAQRLRTGEAHMIALLSSMPFAIAGGPSRLGFLMEIAAVAATAALTRGLALVLAPPMENGAVPLELLDVDGALVVEPSARDPNIEVLQQRGLPVVAIGRQPGSGDTVPFVDIHSAETTQRLLDHLDAQGARRVAMVLGSAQRNSYLEAEATYRAAVGRRGAPCLLMHADEQQGEAGGYQATLALLSAHSDIDAFCVPVDAFAVGTVRALHDAGRRIPQDVMVVTRYDGLRAQTCEPPLTAIDMCLEQTANLAVDLLFEHLRGDGTTHSVSGPETRLVPRASSLR